MYADFLSELIKFFFQGLKNLHDNNLIHVDVKLDNILMTSDGVCKLADFGLLIDMSLVCSHSFLSFCSILNSEVGCMLLPFHFRETRD